MDIDIDTPTNFNPTDHFDVVCASMVKDQNLVKHPVGVYFQTMPIDPITNLSSIPYKDAEDFGYLKIDFLHLSLLDDFSSKEEIRSLLKLEPDWKMLLDPEVVAKLFQLKNHYKLVLSIRPTSVIVLADAIALIRPNKRQLLQKYLTNKEEVRKVLYRTKTDDKSAFRKGHAIAYAHNIILQLHLIKGGIL